MKIISNYRDYYDGYADQFTNDYKIKHYIREQKDIEISKYLLQDLEENLLRTPLDFRAAYMIIAGNVYPFVSVYNNGTNPDSYYFDTESLMDRYMKEKDILDRERKYKKIQYWQWRIHPQDIDKKNMENFFNRKYPDMTKLCIEHDTPIIYISPESGWYRNKNRTFRTCTKNVNLKEFGLSKLFTASDMYQIIDMFVSNVLVKDEMPMSPMSNEEKIQSHGFDKKSSFRHPVK
jgi:hypothetical protein